MSILDGFVYSSNVFNAVVSRTGWSCQKYCWVGQIWSARWDHGKCHWEHPCYCHLENKGKPEISFFASFTWSQKKHNLNCFVFKNNLPTIEVHDMKTAVNDSHAVAQQQINQKAWGDLNINVHSNKRFQIIYVSFGLPSRPPFAKPISYIFSGGWSQSEKLTCWFHHFFHFFGWNQKWCCVQAKAVASCQVSGRAVLSTNGCYNQLK